MNKEKREELNFLLIHQAYLLKKIQLSQNPAYWGERLATLMTVQSEIQAWYKKQSDKIKHQSRVSEFQESEKTRIYHHEIHKKHLKKSSILKLETESGFVEGHDACANYLENLVSDLLLQPAVLEKLSQDALLAEIDTVVTEADNAMLKTTPTKAEVLEALKAANHQAAPGTDGITSLVYRVCWDYLGDALTAVVQSVFQGESLPVSMRTTMMIFGAKPKKPKSLKPGDKRRISQLNCDFKLCEGIEARRFRKLGSKCLSPVQYVAGNDKNIHHGIGKARDAIQATIHSRQGCGIADMDFIAAFDWMVLSWVWMVLLKLGVEVSVVSRLQKLYEKSITIVVVNNKLGRVMTDIRGSLRQGGCASMEWFAFGIDPLLRYLEKRLQGILLASLPVLGPTMQGELMPLPRLEERFKLIAYCDDVKPAITTMAEFFLVDKSCALFENSSGCKLHRDPASGKCKFLSLGRWRGLLEQEDIPLRYLVLTSSLEMVGVELKASWAKSRKANGDILQSRVSTTINAWKSGKFMDITSRPWSANSFALSKVWFRCHTVDLRVLDITAITSKVKSWIFQDQLEKPAEMIFVLPNLYGRSWPL